MTCHAFVLLFSARSQTIGLKLGCLQSAIIVGQKTNVRIALDGSHSLRGQPALLFLFLGIYLIPSPAWSAVNTVCVGEIYESK